MEVDHVHAPHRNNDSVDSRMPAFYPRPDPGAVPDVSLEPKIQLYSVASSALKELRDMGIRVTGIFPGYVATAMTAE